MPPWVIAGPRGFADPRRAAAGRRVECRGSGTIIRRASGRPLAARRAVHDPSDVLRNLGPLAQASLSSHVNVAGARLHIPGSLKIRLSVVASNIRLHRLIDETVAADATAVDVGANIGYNTVYLARRVGARGRVVAIEPAADNARVLRENVRANALANVVVHAVAAGPKREVRDLFLRGETSAVNSLFHESVYASVTGVEKVAVVPVDEIVEGDADFIKIDVEGAELDALEGMTRLLSHAAVTLVVEWHPRLQEAAGHAAEALPRFLLRHGFKLRAASHTRVTPLDSEGIDAMCVRLRRAGRPVELLATR
jgi:FkbM family methyltransferase